MISRRGSRPGSFDIDRAIAAAWAAIAARGRARGATPPILDAFMAATALVHQLTLVTRNERDLAGLDVPIINPWRAQCAALGRIAQLGARLTAVITRKPMSHRRHLGDRGAGPGRRRQSLASDIPFGCGSR
jgi:hypothetical protein